MQLKCYMVKQAAKNSEENSQKNFCIENSMGDNLPSISISEKSNLKVK